MNETHLPAHLHTTNYLDTLPKEKLVILSNDSPNVLTHFDGNVTYVLGAFVDLAPKGPLMLSKAKEMNVETARLPFNLYRQFRLRKKIPLNQYLDIMLEVKCSRDWNKAFNCLPQRLFK